MTPRWTAGGGTAGRSVLRWIWPWLLALGLLAFLLSRVSLDQLVQAIRQGPVGPVAAFVLLQVAVLLVADGLATRSALSAIGLRAPWKEVTLIRGVTYLPGLVSYAAGQGAMGLFLHRLGMRGTRLVSGVGFLIGTNAIVLLALGGSGLIVSGAVDPIDALVAVAVFAALAGCYVAVLVHPPAWLERRRFAAPFLQAGLRGHALAIAARLPHVAALAFGQWAAMRLWGIPVPAAGGLARVAVVLLVAALPIAPAGIGTTQAAQVLLFSEYAPFADDADRRAFILGFALVYQAAGLMAQLLAGMLCLMSLRRRWPVAVNRGRPCGPDAAPRAEGPSPP